MATSCEVLRCLHCDATVSTSDINDGWCGGCGKRLPSSYKENIKPGVAAINVAALEPEAGKRERYICGGIIFALMSMLAVVVIQNLLP